MLGGAYDLPHAELHTVVLPQVVAFQRPALPEAMGRVARALSAESAAGGLHALALAIGAPTALRDIGMREEDLEDAVGLVLEKVPADNPRPVEEDDVRRLLEAAFEGRSPESMIEEAALSTTRNLADERPDPGRAGVLRGRRSPNASRRSRTASSAICTRSRPRSRLTEEEWFAGIDFLTRTGHITDDKRQEFILLSDVLGLSMLVVGLNNRRPPEATESTVFGPFFVEGAPAFANGDDIAGGAPGEPCFMAGRSADASTASRSPARASTSGRPTRTASTTSSTPTSTRRAGAATSRPATTAGSGSGRSSPRRIRSPPTARWATCSRPAGAARCGPRTCTSRSPRTAFRR